MHLAISVDSSCRVLTRKTFLSLTSAARTILPSLPVLLRARAQKGVATSIMWLQQLPASPPSYAVCAEGRDDNGWMGRSRLGWMGGAMGVSQQPGEPRQLYSKVWRDVDLHRSFAPSQHRARRFWLRFAGKPPRDRLNYFSAAAGAIRLYQSLRTCHSRIWQQVILHH